jgi:hypothetical protein
MTDRIIRPRAWAAVLAVVVFMGGAAAMAVIPNPFAVSPDNPRLVKLLLLGWVLAGALLVSGGFRLLAWRTFRMDGHAIESRSMLGRRRCLWTELKQVERLTRVLKLTFSTGVVRVLSNHYPANDIAAIESIAKLVMDKAIPPRVG